MNRSSKLKAVIAVLLLAGLTGCATILGGGSNQSVTIQATPSGASYSILSSSGLQMRQGTTPATITLPRKNEYQIEISLDGYHPQTTVLTRGTNGWIWGNLVVGWLVGFGVDFLTGSAYKLEPAFVQISLQEVGDEMFVIVELFDDSRRKIDERHLRMIPTH